MKNTGDGFLLEFPSVVGAIEGAIAMQVLMAERNAQLPADRAMRFRMGVHMGDVIADEDEVFGDDVNIAVRLKSVASPGGVAVSDKAYREAGKHLSAPLVNAGIHRLKNIDELVNIWSLGAGRLRDAKPSRAKASDLPAQYRTAIVGVLPFANLSDSTDEYFADGLTEDLIHALSLQSFYRVLSRNSTFAFKGKNLTARLIAREIDATYLIQGSVRRAGSKIRVTAELIAPETGEQLWAGRYDRDIGDLFALQDETHHQPVGCAGAGDLSRRGVRSGARDIGRPHRLGPLPARAVALLPADQAGFRSLDRAVPGSDRARSCARHRARLSRHHHGAGRAIRLDQEHGRIVDGGHGLWRRARSGSTRVRPMPFKSCLTCTA